MAVEALLGALPAGWTYATLGEACRRGGGDIQTGPFGSQLHAADYVQDGVPSIMPANIGDNRVIEDGIARISEADAQRLQRYRVRVGDIIYSRRGDVERRALIRSTEDGWLCGTGCLRVRLGHRGADPNYAAYYLGHPSVREWIVRHAHGATMANLNTSILSNCPFVLPPPEDQRAIGSVLGSLDDKIELNRRINETLEAMARAIFKSWFVDFHPVRAKSEGKNPFGMDDATAALFPDRFGADGLPEGWREGPPLQLAEIISGGTPKTTEPGYWDGNIAWATAKDVSQCWATFLIKTERSISESGLDNSSAKIVPARSTVVVARGATTGRHCMFGADLAMNQTCYALRARDRDHYFLFCWFGDLVRRLVHAGHGSVFNTITTRTFDTARALIPKQSVRKAFDETVTPLFELILAQTKQSESLATLRDLLLPKLMSGEVRVGHA